MMITGAANIENVRRLTIIHALRLYTRISMWPNGASKRLVPQAVRSYGWTGRTMKSALEFMEQLGPVTE